MKNLDKKFLGRLMDIYWEIKTSEILDAFSIIRPTTFRINTLKSDEQSVEEELNNLNIQFEKIKEIPFWIQVNKDYEYRLKWSDIFYSWKIYLQSISSMLPAIALAPDSWDTVLDMTAAPWWKTTQMAAMMRNIWEIIAIEINQIRFDKLNYNTKLQWATCIKSIKADAKNLSNITSWKKYDKILLDAPCSAEWRINLNNEKSYWFWSEENIIAKQKLQLDLARTAVSLLNQNWALLYSTCTLAPEENEWVISKLLEEFSFLSLEDIHIDMSEMINWLDVFKWITFDKNISKTKRILPSSRTEGFYMAKLVYNK